MSGTLRNIRIKKQQKEALRSRVSRQNLKQIMLYENRQKIIAQICRTFEWSDLDDFAKNMIDEAFAGQLVNLEKLKKDLQDWKQSKKEQESDSASVSS